MTSQPAGLLRWRRAAARRLDPAAYRKGGRKAKGSRRIREELPELDPAPPMSRHELLAGLHDVLAPRTYLEIGVRQGWSLALSRTRTVAVDPVLRVSSEINCDLQLVGTTSDELFARPDPLAHLGGVPVDLAFVDGMHLAEYAYRDVMNTVRHLAATGVILIDDMLPRSVLEAGRVARTVAWAGDVFKVALLLREVSPDLLVLPVNTAPTGTVLVLGVDPGSTALADAYEALLPRLSAPDPQQVPPEVLARTGAADPREVLASPVWEQLRALREAGAGAAEVAPALAPLRALGVVAR